MSAVRCPSCNAPLVTTNAGVFFCANCANEAKQNQVFDPYYTWLGIPPCEQPSNHYRLLGIAVFESKPDVINHAADRQMAYLRSVSIGKRAAQAQTLLNEIAVARRVLLNTAQRQIYDNTLKSNAPSTEVQDTPYRQSLMSSSAGERRTQSSTRKRPRSIRAQKHNQQLPSIVIGGAIGLLFGYLLIFHYVPKLAREQAADVTRKPRTASARDGSAARRSSNRSRARVRGQTASRSFVTSTRAKTGPKGNSTVERPATGHIGPTPQALSQPAAQSSASQAVDNRTHTIDTPSLKPPLQPVKDATPVETNIAAVAVHAGLPSGEAKKACWVSRFGNWGEPIPLEWRIVNTSDKGMLVEVDSKEFFVSGVPIGGKIVGQQIELSRLELEDIGMKHVAGTSVVHLRATGRTIDEWVAQIDKGNPQIKWLTEGEKIYITVKPPFKRPIEVHARYLNRTEKQVIVDVWTLDEQPVNLKQRGLVARRDELELFEATLPFWVIATSDLKKIKSRPIKHPRKNWRKKDDTVLAEASFVKFFSDGNRSMLTLQTADGKSFDVPMSDLSKDDREWVPEYLKYLKHDPPNPVKEAAVARIRAGNAAARRSKLRRRQQQGSRNFWRNVDQNRRRWWDMYR